VGCDHTVVPVVQRAVDDADWWPVPTAFFHFGDHGVYLLVVPVIPAPSGADVVKSCAFGEVAHLAAPVPRLKVKGFVNGDRGTGWRRWRWPKVVGRTNA